MSETEAAINEVASASAATSPKAKGKKIKAATVGGAPKKPKSKPNHPPTSEMVQNAIKTLKERGGSSLQAIKKFVSATYKIDADKLSPFIKKYLKSAVTSGQLVQTKGKGASGSFRLPAAKKTINDKPKVNKKVAAKKPSEKKPKAVAKKVAAATGAKKATAKKPVSEKKKSAVSAKNTKKIGVKSAPKQKSTKPAKSAAKTPKAPKPKKASGTPKKSIKK